ncbi:MAG TPA: hypothetical protein EYH54_04020 [Nautiliaceae bacterium]|nr:hypothetical protein [Nautiliaceae bacterium]
MNKSQGLTLNTIVIAVLVLIVLVTLALIFGGKLFNFTKKTTDIEEAATGSIDVAKCRLVCINFNSECIIEEKKTGGQRIYKVSGKDICRNYKETLEQCKNQGFIESAGGKLEEENSNREELECKA